MSYEDIPIEIVNRLCKEYLMVVGDDSENSFFDIIKEQIQESIRSEFEFIIEEKVIPLVRNLEIQNACQVSKTNEFYSELKKSSDHLTLQISKLSDQINLLRSNSQSQLEKIEAAMKTLNRKADIYELQALAREVTSMTPLNTFYQLQEWTQTLASKAEIIRIDKELEKIRALIKNCPTFDEMQNELANVVVNMKLEISKEKTALINKIGEVKELVTQNEEKIEFSKSKMQQNNEILSKRIGEVQEQVLSKPWSEDCEVLLQKINTKAKSTEIQDLRNLMEPKLDEFIEKFNRISEDLLEYTTILARFDEVILTKASKDDLRMTQKTINSMVLQATINPILEEIYKKIKDLEDLTKGHKSAIDDAKKEILTYTTVIASQKAQAKDHGKIMDSIKTLAETLKEKADKSDIYSLFDVMGYRDDIINLSGTVGKIKDYFHQAVVLQYEAVGTLILSGDSPVSKNKKRIEIGKNLEFLLKKINLSQESITNAVQTSNNSKRKLNSMTSIHIDSFVDEKISVSRTMSTKARRIASAANNKRNSLSLI